VSVSEIQDLLDAWRAADRAQGASNPAAPDSPDRKEEVDHARDAFLHAVRERARAGYASGARGLDADIYRLRAAELRRDMAERGTVEYDQAVRDVIECCDRMVGLIIAHQVQGEEAREGLRRLMGLPPDGASDD
jgi:hypothetical protein